MSKCRVFSWLLKLKISTDFLLWPMKLCCRCWTLTNTEHVVYRLYMRKSSFFFSVFMIYIEHFRISTVMYQLWQFVTPKKCNLMSTLNMTYRIYQIDKALFNFSFLLSWFCWFFFLFLREGKASRYLVFFPFKYVSFGRREKKNDGKKAKKEKHNV